MAHRASFEDVEAWAEHYVGSTDLSVKLAPPPPPDVFRRGATPRRLLGPGRPPELRSARRGDRLPKPEALRETQHRAKIMHAFLHHELQAAELMCWAILAFADAEGPFRRGLLRICQDEIRHMRAYQRHLERLGHRVGDFPVRDWFWTRVPSCKTKTSFVAVMGMGFEAANLEHSSTFAERFRAAGDEDGARVQERIGREEIAHVRFATKWFATWTGGCDFATWAEALPPPWSPMLMRGDPIAEAARLRAGMSEAFVAELRAYVPAAKGRTAPT